MIKSNACLNARIGKLSVSNKSRKCGKLVNIWIEKYWNLVSFWPKYFCPYYVQMVRVI